MINQEKSLHNILKTLERESLGIQEESKKPNKCWMDYDGLECIPLDIQLKHNKTIINHKFGRIHTEITFELDGNDKESQKVILDMQESFSSTGYATPSKSKKNIKILKQSKQTGSITILIHGFFPTTISTEADSIGTDTWRIEGMCDYYELI